MGKLHHHNIIHVYWARAHPAQLIMTYHSLLLVCRFCQERATSGRVHHDHPPRRLLHSHHETSERDIELRRRLLRNRDFTQREMRRGGLKMYTCTFFILYNYVPWRWTGARLPPVPRERKGSMLAGDLSTVRPLLAASVPYQTDIPLRRQ